MEAATRIVGDGASSSQVGGMRCCRSCGRRYSVKKKEKRTRMTNLPMSFGFRSLYWDKIESSEGGIYGISEHGYEIREI